MLSFPEKTAQNSSNVSIGEQNSREIFSFCSSGGGYGQGSGFRGYSGPGSGVNYDLDLVVVVVVLWNREQRMEPLAKIGGGHLVNQFLKQKGIEMRCNDAPGKPDADLENGGGNNIKEMEETFLQNKEVYDYGGSSIPMVVLRTCVAISGSFEFGY